MEKNNEVNVGGLLKAHLDEKRIHKSVLAKRLGIDDSGVLYYQKSKDLKPSILLKICHVLEHNFFADLAAQLPAEYTQNTPLDLTKDQEIAQLKDEIRLLKAQIEVLR